GKVVATSREWPCPTSFPSSARPAARPCGSGSRRPPCHDPARLHRAPRGDNRRCRPPHGGLHTDTHPAYSAGPGGEPPGPAARDRQSDLPLNCVESFFDALGALNVAAQHWPFSDWIWAVAGSGSGSEKVGMLSPFALNWAFALPARPAFRRTLSAPVGVWRESL